jgi:hypothetical protein
MLHAYVQRFDVTVTAQKFLAVFGTKHGLNASTCVKYSMKRAVKFLRLCSVQKKKTLCKQKISRHIKLAIHAWSTKCR